MDAVEQAVAEQPRDRRAQHGFGRGRNELHRAVAAVTRDHVAHVSRQQAIAVFLDIEQRHAGARQRFGAEGKARGIERRRRDAERHEDAAQRRVRHPAPATCRNVRARSAARAHDSASAEANATTRREADSAASSGTTTSQTAAKDSMPPVVDRHHHDETRQRQRRQHMRAFVAAGARQEPGQQDRRDQPGEGRDLERASARRASPDRPETPQAPTRLPSSRGAMNARWRARVSASYRAEGCSNASRQSRMILKTVTALALRLVRQTDAPERPLYRCATVSERT